MFDTVRKEAVYPFPPEQVWVAITDPRAIAEWLMPNDFQPVNGHRFRFQVDPSPGCGNGITECEVMEVQPPSRLVYSWLPRTKEGRPLAGRPSTVTWTLHREGAGTRLVLEHTGLLGVFPWWQRLMLRMGWGTMVKRWLPKVASNAAAGGAFTPGAIPLEKRCYRTNTIPANMIR